MIAGFHNDAMVLGGFRVTRAYAGDGESVGFSAGLEMGTMAFQGEAKVEPRS